MSGKRYLLKAQIDTVNSEGVQAALEDLVGVDGIMGTNGGFTVMTTKTGESARELNRAFLSALRRVEKRTTLRAEWTYDGVTERFFDYVPKGIRKA